MSPNQDLRGEELKEFLETLHELPGIPEELVDKAKDLAHPQRSLFDRKTKAALIALLIAVVGLEIYRVHKGKVEKPLSDGTLRREKAWEIAKALGVHLPRPLRKRLILIKGR